MTQRIPFQTHACSISMFLLKYLCVGINLSVILALVYTSSTYVCEYVTFMRCMYVFVHIFYSESVWIQEKTTFSVAILAARMHVSTYYVGTE